jgi:N-acetylglutamate synthase-like GNAT family acetyltransferase
MVSTGPPAIDFRSFDMDAVSDIERLASWSRESPEMLPLSVESIARHHLSTGAYILGELAGYGAISVIYSREVVEFGGLLVSPNFRGHGVATALVKHVVSKAREELDPMQVLTFTNEKSFGLFKRLGGVVIDDMDTLPNEVWKLCHICPSYGRMMSAGKICCNRVLDITNIDVAR